MSGSLLFWHCQIVEEDRSQLEVPVNDSEIFEALISLKPYKALRLDGLHADFFQRFWLIVGNSVK